MRFHAFVCLTVVASSTAVYAHPNPYNGRYTLKKGACSEEYRVDITPKALNHYEDLCKITKSETKPGYLKKPVTYLDLKCSSEGETDYREVWLQDGERAGTIEEYYPRESPAKTVVLYRCIR